MAIHNYTFKDSMYKLPDSHSLQEGDAVKYVNNELVLCSTDEDSTCVGLLGSFELSTAAGSLLLAVKDCYGNTFSRETDPIVEKAVRKVCTDGISNNAKLCDDGGAISAGDLLTTSSAKPGFLKKQSDNIVRSHTVAQARFNASFDGNGEASSQTVLVLK